MITVFIKICFDCFINKKTAILIFSIIFLLFSLSCKKSLLEPTKIPKPTIFLDKNKTNIIITPPAIEADIEVKPVISPDGAVFGGFINTFVYKNERYIMAKHMYKYKADNTLEKIEYRILLKIDENNITIVAKDNIPAWFILNLINTGLIYDVEYEIYPAIEADRIRFNTHNLLYYHYQENSTTNVIAITPPFPLSGSTRKYMDYIERHIYIYVTTDLVNYKIITNREPVIRFPTPDYINGNNWQGRTGIGTDNENKPELKILYFKGYLYVLGGCFGFHNANPSGSRNSSAGEFNATVDTVKRIKIDVDNTIERNITYIGGWEEYKAPFGAREEIVAGISCDGNKMYIRGGYKDIYRYASPTVWKHEKDTVYTDIWSTTDGIKWEKDSLYDGRISGLDNLAISMTPKTYPENSTPTIKNYTYCNLGFGSGSSYSVNNFTNNSSIDKITNEIRRYAMRGDFNFPIEDYKNFLINSHVSDIVIYSNKSSTYHAITAKNTINTNFIWSGQFEGYIFNINGKLVRLIDYDFVSNTPYFADEPSITFYSNQAYNFKNGIYISFTNGTGKFKYQYTKTNIDWSSTIISTTTVSNEYSQEDCAYWSMYFNSYKYLAELYYTNSKLLMPNKPVTHYSIEFQF